MLIPRRFGLGRFQCINMVEKNWQYFANLQKKHCNNLQIFAHTEIAKCAKSCNILQICNKYKNVIICKFAHTKIAKFCKFAKKIAI